MSHERRVIRRTPSPHCKNGAVQPVDLSLFAASPVDVAPHLLGMVVEHAGVSVRITEVEAYHGARDPGSHGFRGRTPRNAALFGPPGTVYVYISYGIHRAFNLVCAPDGESGGCLIRAGEVVGGMDLAQERRGGGVRRIEERMLARGPGNLGQALAVDIDLNGTPVAGPDAVVRVLVPDAHELLTHSTGPRVGVSGPGGDGAAYPWRFWLPGEPSVSAYRPGGAKRASTRVATQRTAAPKLAKGGESPEPR